MTQSTSTQSGASSKAKNTVKAEAKKAADAVNAEASKAKQSAEQAGAAAKDKVAAEAQDTSARVREAGDAFEDGSFAQIAASQIADNLSSAADAVRSTDLADLQADLTQFARRNPALFFGGAAVLGFALTRMAKASARADEGGYDAQGPYAPPHHHSAKGLTS
ncbi:MAG: hypothetical protein AAF218_06640 [Pseudomonadota bacterium]